MPVSTDDFWRLLTTSELASPSECESLRQHFLQRADASPQANSSQTAEWLVAEKKLTRYQADILLSGRPGPFVFGPFTIIDRVPRGRLERVFRASYQGRQRVMLVPLAALTGEPDEYRDLIELASRCAAVKNPHVSRTLQTTRQRGQAFVVLEVLDGGTLHDAVSGKRLPVSTACRLACQAALGLAAIHEQQLVHGGLAPQNLWLTPQGSLKILQFPLVPPAARSKHFELPLADYTAPELANCEALPNPLTDIYALGCVIYALLAGQPPFAGGTPDEKRFRHPHDSPPAFDKLAAELPADLVQLIESLLAKDPLLRCPSATEAAHVLARLAKSGPTNLAGNAGSSLQPSAELPRDSRSQPLTGHDPPDETVSAADSPPRPARRSVSAARGARWGAAWWIAGATAMLLLVAGVFWNQALKTAPVVDASATVEAAPALDTPVNSEAEVVAAETTLAPLASNLIEDDGRTLWESPTDGAPLELHYLPHGSQVILALRPADLLHSAEGPKLLAALGPAGQSLPTVLERALGVELEDVEQLFIAFAADEELSPRASYVAVLGNEAPREALLEAWGHPALVEHADKQFFERDGLAYYLPETGDGHTLVVSTTAWMREILELDGVPLLRSSLEQLLAASDEQRTFTLILNPRFLFTDGGALMRGPLAQLREPLETFLGPDIDAVSISANLDIDLYLEFRASAPVDRRPGELLSQLRTHWEKLPAQLESNFATSAPRPHGADVLRQFPDMLKTTRAYTRSSLDGRQLVMNAYLPIAAAHNLLLGADLALLESAPQAPALTTTTAPQQGLSASDALARQVTLSFPRETLEGALGVLAREIGAPIIIVGNDLQLEGITRNQSLNDFEARRQPAEQILRRLLALANPEGKLVYQIKPDAAGRSTIFITTRSAVTRRGEQPADGS